MITALYIDNNLTKIIKFLLDLDLRQTSTLTELKRLKIHLESCLLAPSPLQLP